MWLALANEDLWLELLKPHSQQTEIHVAGCARDIWPTQLLHIYGKNRCYFCTSYLVMSHGRTLNRNCEPTT